MSATILLISTLLQFAAGFLALRLGFIYGNWRAWSFIAIALALMGVRRLITFYHVLVEDVSLPPNLVAEMVALSISVLMVVGVFLIGPLFKSIQRTQEKLVNNEANLQGILDNLQDTYYRADTDGRVIMASPAATELLGYDTDELIGKDLSSLYVNPEGRKAFLQRLEKEGGKIDQFETALRHKDGHEITVSTNTHYWHDPDGKISGVEGTVRDITQNKKTEALSTRLGRIIEQSLNEIYTFDAKTLLFVQVNLGARVNLGYSMEELQGMTPVNIKPNFTHEKFEDLVKPLRDGSKEKVVFETSHLCKDGSTYEAEIHLQLVKIETPEVFVAIVQDITDRLQTEETVLRALTEAQLANKAKSEFLATMSHELRTPLNAIIGFSGILTGQFFGTLGSPKYKEYAENIEASSDHLLNLVNDILDLSAIEAGEHSVTRENVIIEDAIAYCSAMIADAVNRKSIEYSVIVPNDISSLYADQRAFRQVFLNLLTNAVKFGRAPEKWRDTSSFKRPCFHTSPG